MNEHDLEVEVTDLCEKYGLRWHACGDSIRCRGQRGHPDMIIAGPGGILYRELKAPTRKPTPQQADWGWVLRATGADWAIWRPIDLESGRIETELREIGQHTAA